MTAQPEVNEKHTVGNKNHYFGLLQSRLYALVYIRDMYIVLITSHPPLFTSPIRGLLPLRLCRNHRDN